MLSTHDNTIQQDNAPKKAYSNEEMALYAAALAVEKQGTQPVVLDLRHLGAFSDYFTIVSAENSRHVYALASEIRKYFKEQFKLSPLMVDGLVTCDWALLDYGFLYIHIFQESCRQTYQLEQLWCKARALQMLPLPNTNRQ